MSLQTLRHMSWRVSILIPMRMSIRMVIAIEHQVVMSESVAIRSILPVRSENTTAARIPCAAVHGTWHTHGPVWKKTLQCNLKAQHDAD